MSDTQTAVRGNEGMVATSHPLAAKAGADALNAGGTAADAAVAAAAVLCVVDPRSTGIGGDAFALYWPAGASEPVGLDGAGPAPLALSADTVRAAGHAEMPSLGPLTVTVPGAVSLWEALIERFGLLGIDTLLTAAIGYARDGFAVTRFVAEEWRQQSRRLRRDPTASATFLRSGHAPAAGDRWANPELAASLERLTAEGGGPMYRGPLAEAITAAVNAAGGVLEADDLADWEGARWVKPLRARYRDVDVYELPPPGQGVVVLEALGIFAPLEFADRATEEHVGIEALKLAFTDAWSEVSDPKSMRIPVERLLGSEHLESRRALIDAEAAWVPVRAQVNDTVYVAAADEAGSACSLIQSLYEGFGSGIAVPGTGILLQNRGAGFVLEDGHPNAPSGGRRPYHTIIPAVLGRDGGFYGCLGVVGGFMQPQAQMQILRQVVDHGTGIQAAIDAPRVRYWQGRGVAIEPGYDERVAAELRRRGHELVELGRFAAGGAQAILADGGEYVGASDPRKDGCARALDRTAGHRVAMGAIRSRATGDKEKGA